MSATPAASRTADLDRLLADAAAWNRWADQMNQRALALGLVSPAELERDRAIAQAATARLQARLEAA